MTFTPTVWLPVLPSSINVPFAVFLGLELKALVEQLLPYLETEVVIDLKAAARAAVVEEASRAFERRLAVGPYERDDLTVLQKIIKADSGLRHDQVRWEVVVPLSRHVGHR